MSAVDEAREALADAVRAYGDARGDVANGRVTSRHFIDHWWSQFRETEVALIAAVRAEPKDCGDAYIHGYNTALAVGRAGINGEWWDVERLLRQAMVNVTDGPNWTPSHGDIERIVAEYARLSVTEETP